MRIGNDFLLSLNKYRFTVFYKLKAFSLGLNNKFHIKPKLIKEDSKTNKDWFFYFLCFKCWLSIIK